MRRNRVIRHTLAAMLLGGAFPLASGFAQPVVVAQPDPSAPPIAVAPDPNAPGVEAVVPGPGVVAVKPHPNAPAVAVPAPHGAVVRVAQPAPGVVAAEVADPMDPRTWPPCTASRRDMCIDLSDWRRIHPGQTPPRVTAMTKTPRHGH